MTVTTRELLAALARLNREVPAIALGIADESLSPDKQSDFGDLLIAAGKALQHHARSERAVVVDSAAGPGEGVSLGRVEPVRAIEPRGSVHV